MKILPKKKKKFFIPRVTGVQLKVTVGCMSESTHIGVVLIKITLNYKEMFGNSFNN